MPRRRRHPGLPELSAALARFDRRDTPATTSGDADLARLGDRLARLALEMTHRVGSVAAAVPIRPGTLDPDDDLRRQLETRARAGDPPAVADARRMLAHLESLHALMDLARRTGRRPPD